MNIPVQNMLKCWNMRREGMTRINIPTRVVSGIWNHPHRSPVHLVAKMQRHVSYSIRLLVYERNRFAEHGILDTGVESVQVLFVYSTLSF